MREQVGTDVISKFDNVHRCSNCGHTVSLDQIGILVITTGVITCTACGKSGPVSIHIVPKDR